MNFCDARYSAELRSVSYYPVRSSNPGQCMLQCKIPMSRFENKIALITGASRGIGRASAVRLASEGATIAINYSRSADAKYPGAAEEALSLVKAAGGQGALFEADVSDTAAMRRL